MRLTRLVGVLPHAWTMPLRLVVRRLRAARSKFAVKLARKSLRECDSVFSYTSRISLQHFLLSGATLKFARSAHPTISVIVMSTTPAELLFACLRSLQAQRFDDIELVLVDNAPTDESVRLLEKIHGACVVAAGTGTILHAINRAAEECCGEYLLLLSPGAQLLDGAMTAILNSICTSPQIGAVGAKLVLGDGTLYEAGTIVSREGAFTAYGRGEDPLVPAYNFRRKVDSCSGAFFLTPRRVWNRLGGLDETLWQSRCEIADYCARLWEEGLQVVYEPSATGLYYEPKNAELGKSIAEPETKYQRLFAERHAGFLSRRGYPHASWELSARSCDDHLRVLFLDDRVPHAWLGSGFPRARTLLQAIHRRGYFVTFYPLSVADEPLDAIYSDIPREIEMVNGTGRDLLESFLKARRGYYSTIVVSRPHNMRTLKPIIEAHPNWFAGVRLIYDAEALFTMRDITHHELTGDALSAESKAARMREEIDLTSVATCVVSVSEAERRMFIDHGINERNAYVLGHSLEIEPGDAPFAARSGLLFAGAVLEGSPNADSLLWFLREVFPRVRQQLGETIRLTIAGINTSPEIKRLAGPTVDITGPLPSLRHLYDASRLFIAPTRYGAGIAHKLHEAAAYGVPVITTPLIAAQVGWGECELGIGGTADTYAAACVRAYSDENLWTAMRRAALNRVHVDCSPQKFDQTVGEIFKCAAIAG